MVKRKKIDSAFLEKNWLVEKIVTRPSVVNSNLVSYIDLIDLDDGSTAMTYASTEYKNYTNWRYIVDNNDKGFIISNLQTKNEYTKDGKLIINADSRPIIDHESNNKQQLIEIVYDELEQKLQNNKPNPKALFILEDN